MKLILCGDICPTLVTEPAFEDGDLEALMGDTLPVIQRGDYSIANLECALTVSDTPIRKMGPICADSPIMPTCSPTAALRTWDFPTTM